MLITTAWDEDKTLEALGMAKLESGKTHAEKKPLTVEIHINRRYSYVSTFFKPGLPILEGSTFPLKARLFEGGRIRLGEDAKVLGASALSIDVRNLTYAIPST
jgi:hypothetical protein